MTRRGGARLTAAASAGAFVAAFFLRMNSAYGPFNLSLHPSDWTVLWELLRHGQIASRIVVESALLGAAAAVVPWTIFGLTTRRRGKRPS
jgi:hypothetical protein